jgi:uncharacterized membrane protein
MNAAELSREWRFAKDDRLRWRRGIVALSVASATTMGLLSLFQTGVIRRLPDLNFWRFDAEKVDSAPEAYEMLESPDAPLGLLSYGATAALAAAGGGRDRTDQRPWLSAVLAGKVLVDAGFAAKLTYDQWSKQKAYCIWCLLAAGATFATVPLALKEARAALRR